MVARFLKSALMLCLLLPAACAFADTLATATFEGPVDSIGVFEWDEAGLKFDGPPAFNIITPLDAPGCAFGGCVTDGTNVGVIQETTVLATQSGDPFALLYLDYSTTFNEFTPGFSSATLTLIGDYHGGGTVTETLVISPIPGFVTFNFGPEWSGLDDVRFFTEGPNSYASIDNLGAEIPAPRNPVPEPASVALLGTGLLGAARLLRKRIR